MWKVALAAFLLCLTGEALAQEAPEATGAALPSDDALAELLDSSSLTAQRAYELGVRLFEADRYEAAERAWLAAYSLGRDPALLFAVAEARQLRGDEPGAVSMLEQYLAQRPAAPDRVAVEARIAALLQSPARLVIRSREPGRAIVLDGAPVEQRTPAEIEVKPGMHTVVLVGEGVPMRRRIVEVAYGHVEELDFAPDAPGELAAEEADKKRLEAQLARDREDLTIRRAIISTGSIAAAALVPGTVLCVLAAREKREHSDDPTTETGKKSDRLAVFSNVSFGLAALSAITSFTLFMTHKNARARQADSARLRIDVHGAGASATLRF
jgi:tetratricopeptide (TPR) repeat protein